MDFTAFMGLHKCNRFIVKIALPSLAVEVIPFEGYYALDNALSALREMGAEPGFKNSKNLVGNSFSAMYGNVTRQILSQFPEVMMTEKFWVAPVESKLVIDRALKIGGAKTSSSELSSKLGLTTGLWDVNVPRTEVSFEFGQKD